jgi:hypothetical protein
MLNVVMLSVIMLSVRVMLIHYETDTCLNTIECCLVLFGLYGTKP